MVNDLIFDLDILPLGHFDREAIADRITKIYNSFRDEYKFNYNENTIERIVMALNSDMKLEAMLNFNNFKFDNYSTFEKPCIKLIEKEKLDFDFKHDNTLDIHKHFKEWQDKTYNWDSEKGLSIYTPMPSITIDSMNSMRADLEASMGLPKGSVFGYHKQDKQDTLKDILRGL